jgi:hypothetical protein
VDYITRRIASSSARRTEFSEWSKKLEIQTTMLIAGYGIRWNVAYDSRSRAYKARKVCETSSIPGVHQNSQSLSPAFQVINQILNNETERNAGKSSKNHFFKGYEVSTKEWESVNSLNMVLKVSCD